MNLSWRFQRQIIIFTIYFLIIFLPVSYIVYNLNKKSHSCFDGIQNGIEEGVDCNGECELRCDGTYRNLKVIFNRGMLVRENIYDIFALIENYNQFVNFPNVPYNLKFYNSAGILLGTASGSISVAPQSKGVIYIPNLQLNDRPDTIELNFSKYLGLASYEKERPILVNVGNWQAQRGANNSLQVVAELKNPYNYSVKNVNIYAMLYDETNTVYAVSKTKISEIKGRENQGITFTWGEINSPSNVEFVINIE